MAETILDIRKPQGPIFHTLDGAGGSGEGRRLTVKAGETVAIVGESGSGKSQMMMAAMGLLASNGTRTGVARLSRHGSARHFRSASSTPSAAARSP